LLLRRTLATVVLGGLVTVGAAGAAAGDTTDEAATTTAAQTIYRTASNSTLLSGPLGFEVDRPFGPGRIRLASSAIVVQTGRLPWNGPGMPVSALTGSTDRDGFRFRLFDQNGAAITEASPGLGTRVYYHASARTADGVHAADLAAVQTDANGWAEVRFARPLQQAPASVIATGSTPYQGPGLPVNLVTDAYNSAGFLVRALDQDGQPIANQQVRVHYWATVQEATPNTRARTTLVTPDARGVGRITWPRFDRRLDPVSVVLTGVDPSGGPNMPVNLVVVTVSGDGASIRALNQAGEPITTPFRVAYYATKRSLS
jgi:hypothetical protein